MESCDLEVPSQSKDRTSTRCETVIVAESGRNCSVMVSPLIKHDLVLLFLVVSIFRVMQTLQIVLVDIPTDAPALAAARLLVAAEMNPGIDAGVRAIAHDSLELCFGQYCAGTSRGRQRNGVASATEDAFRHSASWLLKVP